MFRHRSGRPWIKRKMKVLHTHTLSSTYLLSKFLLLTFRLSHQLSPSSELLKSPLRHWDRIYLSTHPHPPTHPPIHLLFSLLPSSHVRTPTTVHSLSLLQSVSSALDIGPQAPSSSLPCPLPRVDYPPSQYRISYCSLSVGPTAHQLRAGILSAAEFSRSSSPHA